MDEGRTRESGSTREHGGQREESSVRVVLGVGVAVQHGLNALAADEPASADGEGLLLGGLPGPEHNHGAEGVAADLIRALDEATDLMSHQTHTRTQTASDGAGNKTDTTPVNANI